MSQRLMALGWLFVFVLAGLIGHLTAQKLHAIPTYEMCGITPNASCPTCYNYNDPLLGQVHCRMTTASFTVCESSSSGSCGNSKQFDCSGLENTRADCSGLNFGNCDYSFDSCK
jgi:hypothetical protein